MFSCCLVRSLRSRSSAALRSLEARSIKQNEKKNTKKIKVTKTNKIYKYFSTNALGSTEPVVIRMKCLFYA